MEFKGLFWKWPHLKVYSGFKGRVWNLRDHRVFKGLFLNLPNLKAYSGFKGLYWNLRD